MRAASAERSTVLLSPQEPSSTGELRDALEEANLPTLLLAMAQLTGDDRWLQEPYRPLRARGVDDNDSAGLPDEVQAAARREAFEALCAWREGRLEPAAPPSPARIAEMLEISFGSTQGISSEYGPLLAEELGVASRDIEVADPPGLGDFRVLVIGSGLSGLCAAIKLRQAGIPYTIVERNSTVGGTWFENRYPGCGVDTPSHLYSFSFAQQPSWSRYFAKRDELYDYLQHLVDQHGLWPSIRTGVEVVKASWEDAKQCWRVELRANDGGRRTVTANAIISGTGFFSQPAYPKIKGLETFKGPTVHTARWPGDVDIRGRRVAVVGSGASAMQAVPAMAGVAGRVIIFQRSPQWGVPSPNYMREVSPATRLCMREVPFYLGWYRLRQVWNFGDRLHPGLQVDPDWPHPERAVNEINDRLRRFLTDYIHSELGERTDLLPKCLPTYPPYGKRPLLDNGWFRAVCRDDVELVTDPIAEVRGDRLVTVSGQEFDADVLVLATGFHARRVLGPMEVRGRSGRTLRETWGDDDAQAYLGITVPDFPNFFFLLGPNTFAGHGGSAALSIEMETRYIMQLIAHMADANLTRVECRRSVHDAYIDRLDAALSGTIWSHEGMTTYYRNSRGRIVVPMPWTNLEYWKMTREPDLDDYDCA